MNRHPNANRPEEPGPRCDSAVTQRREPLELEIEPLEERIAPLLLPYIEQENAYLQWQF